jgi:hypothetical protein
MLYEYPSLRQGLVGAWVSSLGASGLSLIDRSGWNNHGTLTNMAGQDNWRASGGAVSLRFDGVDDYVSLPSRVNVSTGLPFSISAWVNTVDLTTRLFPNICTLSVTNQTQPLALSVSAQASYVGVLFGAASGFGQFRADPSWASAQWNHVALSYSGATATAAGSFSVHVNGRLVTVTTAAAFASVANTSQLGFNGGANTYLFGNSDDIRIYNRVITLSEIRLLASRRGIGLQPLPDRAAGLPRKLSVNVGGTWRAADAYVNVGGAWKLAQASTNVAGTWR